MSYSHSARVYDALYATFKDYDAESARLLSLIGQYKRTEGMRLLDVACGTGKHLESLTKTFRGEGVDYAPEMLHVARERLPHVTFHQGDMRTFDLSARYDVVTCLFSAIGYMTTLDDLGCAIDTMTRHLLPGGVLLVEPWFAPEQWNANSVHMRTVDEPDLKIARIVHSRAEGIVSIMDMYHTIGTPDGVTTFVEQHRMGLFTPEQYRAAFEAAGLVTTFDEYGLEGRGLWIGIPPQEAR